LQRILGRYPIHSRPRALTQPRRSLFSPVRTTPVLGARPHIPIMPRLTGAKVGKLRTGNGRRGLNDFRTICRFCECSQGRTCSFTSANPVRSGLFGYVTEGRNNSSGRAAGETTARDKSGRFLGIYAWFQSRGTSVRGASRPCADAPVHNPHSFTGLISRVNTVHSSDPACVPGNPAEWVCEYTPFRSFCGRRAQVWEGSTRV
jgi:hypothetical protein